jgi:hypothetical protein
MHKSNIPSKVVQSRTQIMHRLKNLKSFLFLGYLSQIESDVHLVRLQFIESIDNGAYRQPVVADFRVTEGYKVLMAVSTDGRYSFSELK